MAQMYCGDEVAALVVDVGSCNSRLGTGGEAIPKHIIRTVVGIGAEEINGDSSISTNSSSRGAANGSTSREQRRYFGDVDMRLPLPMHVQFPVQTSANSYLKQELAGATNGSGNGSGCSSGGAGAMDMESVFSCSAHAAYEGALESDAGESSIDWQLMDGFLYKTLNGVIGRRVDSSCGDARAGPGTATSEAADDATHSQQPKAAGGANGTSISANRRGGGGPHGNSSARELRDFSLMFAESHFDTMHKKQQLAELCFEQYDTPGLYIAPNAMLTGLSMCKPTSLVVDIGASGTTVSAVVDGYVLHRSVRRSPWGGDMFNRRIMHFLEVQGNSNSSIGGGAKLTIRPWYDVQGTFKFPTPSYHGYHRYNVVQDLKHWISVVPYTRLPATMQIPVPATATAPATVVTSTREEVLMSSLRIPPYELPDGTLLHQSDKLCTTGEALFLPHVAGAGAGSGSGAAITPLPQLIKDSILSCDGDIRRELMSNILLTGGGSLMDGMSNRLAHELTHHTFDTGGSGKKGGEMAFKPKIVTTAMLPAEKSHAAWIGGSVLSICGSFQQCWISNLEYAEQGSNILLDKLS